MNENQITVVVQKDVFNVLQNAITASRNAYDAFDIAADHFKSFPDDDGSVVKEAINLVIEARKSLASAQATFAADAVAWHDAGSVKPLSRAEKARRGAEYLKKRLDDIKSFATGQSDCELQA